MKKKAKNIIDPTVNGIYTPEYTKNKIVIKIPEIGIILLVNKERLKNSTPEQYKQDYINNYKKRTIS